MQRDRMHMRTIQEHSLELAIREEAARYFGGRYGAGLQALVLTGSMARNEATTVEIDGVRRVLGDAEFLLIFRDSASRLPGNGELSADCAQIEAALRDLGIACAIGANRAYPDYLRRMKPHIFGYELKTCGQVLLGDADILSMIPSFSAKDIPCEDGWQLLMNRLIELLKPAAQAPSGTGPLPRDLHYRTVKLYLDMAASLLIFNGSFEAGYRGRCHRLQEITKIAGLTDGSVFCGAGAFACQPIPSQHEAAFQSRDRQGAVEELWIHEIREAAAQWPFPPVEFARRVAEATDYKLSGQTGDPGRGWEYLRDALACAHALWRWELARLASGAGHRFLWPVGMGLRPAKPHEKAPFVGQAILPADSLSAGPAAWKAACFFDPANADADKRSSAPPNPWNGPVFPGHCADATDEQLFACWTRCEPVRSRLRGWASQLRKPAIRRDLRRRPGWIAEAWKASPRYCVYGAAAKLVFRVPELLSGRASDPDSVWNAIARRLPLRAAATGCAPAWRQLALSIARNYKELLIGTRA